MAGDARTGRRCTARSRRRERPTGREAWKRNRLIELGFGVPDWLRLVPVDFEASESWSEQLVAAGFDSRLPAVVVSTGVTMYLTKDATAATLRQLAGLAAGSTLAMDVPSVDRTSRRRRSLRASESGARAAGTPFISFYTPPEMLTLARQAGFGGHYLSAVSCDGTAGHLSR